MRAYLARTYFSLDTRSMGLFRIVFGLVLLTDLKLRYDVLDVFYTNQGLLPNHTLLWAPPSSRMVSVFFTASSHGQALLLMLLCGLVFTMYTLGFHTKLAQVLSLLALTSVNTRLASLENGGDMVMNLLCIWTMFLPLGTRFSIDAVRKSLAARKEVTAAQLADRVAIEIAPERAYSLAVFAVILQFVVIYFFNVVHKNGPTWLDGSAVHYTLHQDRLIKSLGVWLREGLPYGMLRALTYGTIVVETTGLLTIISPVFTKYTRAVAVLLMPTLHLGFELCLDLGVFSFGMMSFFALLIAPEHWVFLRKHFARMHRKRIVFFDASCGVCFAIARLIARLDVLERIEILANTDSARLPPGVDPALTETTVLVVDAENGRVYTRAAAFAALLRSLPFGFGIAWLLVVPGLAQLAGWVYDHIASRRADISVWLGYAACGLPNAPLLTSVNTEPTPARAWLMRLGHYAGQLVVALFMIACCGEIVNANAAVPQALRYRQPAFLQALVEYPRTFQGWRMFAPHAPTEDFNIEVDAITFDGRHVDPYNEVASRFRGPGFTEIPARLGQNQFFTGYSLFIWRPHFSAFRTAFQEWILRYPERTGHPQDRIVSFVVNTLSDRSPPPGQTKNTDFKREPFMRYPHH